MSYEIIGIQPKSYHFTAVNGVVVDSDGYKIYLMSDTPIPEGSGFAALSVYMSNKKLSSGVPSVGEKVRLSYNRFGKVEALEVVQ